MGRVQESKEARKQKRKNLKLKESLVTPQLLKRYQLALVHVTTFLADCNIRIIRYIDQLDDAISSWVEYIFSEGESKSLASDALASIQYHLPQSVGHLRMSWKLARAWQKVEPPARVVPLSPLLVRAFAGACVLADKLDEAAGILAAFDALLRPGGQGSHTCCKYKTLHSTPIKLSSPYEIQRQGSVGPQGKWWSWKADWPRIT